LYCFGGFCFLAVHELADKAFFFPFPAGRFIEYPGMVSPSAGNHIFFFDIRCPVDRGMDGRL
jgi:hypothetical protein